MATSHKKKRTRAYEYSKNITVTALSIAFFSFVGYLYLIGITTMLISEREKLVTDIRTLSSGVAELEIKYFETSSSLDVESAYLLGYSEIDVVHYTYQSTVPSVALSQYE